LNLGFKYSIIESSNFLFLISIFIYYKKYIFYTRISQSIVIGIQLHRMKRKIRSVNLFSYLEHLYFESSI
jgi:hypothetical protein